ncbi:hypothetical protein GH714_028411 [Hevea brasiliensis]|uniref:Protein kinase domain-containing protein n=1 Tax=Hevea brasiliensis TaxID=3981 RepID=A0A6A6N6W3_HEVBR|nr:hypothetical protein GH714_028411 [Hevea brasiliensis]
MPFSHSGDVIEFTAEELKGYIREGKIVGRGAFGPVYKGIIKGRQERNINGEHVAIKFSRNKCERASTQWRAEKDYLPEVKHQNIIKLIGYCESEERFYLVYPFMQNGTALSQLSGLDWHKTLKIIKGVASAIQKLQGFTPALVHRDIKLDNILLDQNFTPKLADFGNVTPEIEDGSKAEDIYSFGEILLQLIAKNEKNYYIGTTRRIGDWARENYPQIKLLHAILEKTGCSRKAAAAITELGLECVEPHPSDRPTIAQVLAKLAYLS